MGLPKIGVLLHPGVRGYDEGIHYNYSPSGHTLTLSTKTPGPSEIWNVRQGLAAFALGCREEVLFLGARFGDRPWQVAHYNWWINPPSMRPNPMDDLHRLNGGLLLRVCLVNATNGLVEAARTARLPHDFSRTLLEAVGQQTLHLFDFERYLEVVEKASARLQIDISTIENTICSGIADFASANIPRSRAPRAYE